MNKYPGLLAAGILIVLASTGCDARYNVYTAEEFLNAIGPNRTILLAPGEYVLSEADEQRMKYVRWDPEFDGKTITVRNVENLKILGCGANGTRLLTRPRYVFVLNFDKCDNVQLENLVLGHSPEEGYCRSGVFGATDCTNIVMRDCDLFGCGTEGLTLTKVRNMDFVESTVRDCAYGIMTMRDCSNLRFIRSSFTRNEEFWGVSVNDGRNVLFRDCEFANNRAERNSLFEVASSANVQVEDCVFTNNKVKSITNDRKVVKLIK